MPAKSIWFLVLMITLGISDVMTGQTEKSSITGDLSLTDVIEGIKMRQEMLNAVHIKFNYECFSGAAEVAVDLNNQFHGIGCLFSYDFEVHRLDDKIRFRKKTYEAAKSYDIPRVDETIAWNGTKETTLASQPTNPEEKPGGIIGPTKSPNYQFDYWQTPIEGEVFETRKTVVQLLETGQWRLWGPEKLGEHDNVYKLEGRQFFAEGDSDVMEIWIDPVRDFAPVKIKHSIPEPSSLIPFPAVYELSEIKLEQRDGVWVIVEAVCHFDLNKPEALKKYENPDCYYKFQVEEYQVNPEMDESLFEIQYPSGTLVFDRFLEIAYTIGVGMPLRDVFDNKVDVDFEKWNISEPREAFELEKIPDDAEIIPAPRQAAERENTGEDAPEIPEQTSAARLSPLNKFIIIGLGSICCLIAVLYLIKKHSRGKTSEH